MIIKLLDNAISNSISIITTSVSITNVDHSTKTISLREQNILFNTLVSESKITIGTSPPQIVQIQS